MPSIEHILSAIPAGQRQLCFLFDHDRDGFTVEATLKLPAGTMFVRTDVPLADHHLAVDQIVDKLAQALRTGNSGTK